MRKKLKKNLVIAILSILLVSFVFTGQAYASWGAAKLAELTGRPVTPTPVNPYQPPSQPQPQPSPEPVPQPEQPQQPVPGTSAMSQQEAVLLQMVNDERVKNGLKPLLPMPDLNRLARMKSQDIIDKNYFSHVSPTYGSFSKMVYDAGIRFYSCGENIAKSRDGRHAFYLFLGSAGHRSNMLNRNFTHIGIGIVPDKYGVVVTQLFIMQ